MSIRKSWNYLGLIGLLALVASTSAQAATPSENPYLKDLELLGWDDLVETRLTCALGKMSAIKAKIDADKELQRFKSPMPETDLYCLKVITQSQSKGRMFDLYIDMALREQGYNGLHSGEQGQLLKNNEAWKTTEAILRAAKADQTTYTSITGKTHNLPCPLALDAGWTWADGNTKAALPLTLTADEVSTIARQCYDPATTHITVRGVAMSAQKAGLFAGVALAKR